MDSWHRELVEGNQNYEEDLGGGSMHVVDQTS